MSKTNGLGGLRPPGERPAGKKPEMFSVEQGNVEVMDKGRSQPSEKVSLGKMDMATNIVSSVSNLGIQLSQSIENVKTARIELDKIRETSSKEIRLARESTKQVSIQEKEHTKRHRREMDKEIISIQADLVKFQEEQLTTRRKNENEHSEKLDQMKMYDRVISRLIVQLEDLIDEMREYRKLGIEVPSELRKQLQDQTQSLVDISALLKQ
ncbi:hypothetical protein MM300_07265 [Evansella sp. LMS18]|uniref:hypothetical protein n=1 Tax=Evansella sp. LMS18 TaxID=2924033 RepID=UPI0020D1320A|nr:hypothetical protein [Evansella sp. LMS18]UTR12083.1 hypothetical protein MM300_07265 [Evansella sp. LMS18]